MSKKKVLGRTFEEPSCRWDDLIDKSIVDSPPALWSLVASFIPVVGIASVIASLISSYTLKPNKYGIAENAWRVTVYGSVIQAVSLTVAYVVFLQ